MYATFQLENVMRRDSLGYSELVHRAEAEADGSRAYVIIEVLAANLCLVM
jgi:hypothetical protein